MAKHLGILDTTLEMKLAAEEERHNREMARLMDAEIARLNALRLKIAGSNGLHRTVAKKPVGAARTRGRRRPEGLKKIAGEILNFVKSKGQDGATSSEILEQKFGHLGPSITKFVEKYAGVKMKHKGPARGRKYFHS